MAETLTATRPTLGHNSAGATIQIEVRLFNTLTKLKGQSMKPRHLELPAGSTIGDVIDELGIPEEKVYLALRNGHDITPGLYGDIDTAHELDSGDVVALSGPVPYSWGYGSPVV